MASRLAGEMDLANAPEAGRRLLVVAQAAPSATVIFDCAELTFIDASGVTMLLDVGERSGKRVRLVNVVACCRRVFEVLDLCAWFGIDEDRPIALRAV